MNCASCKWFKAYISDTDPSNPHGDCRRYPPVFVDWSNVDEYKHEWESPIVKATHWCGEYDNEISVKDMRFNDIP